MSFNFSVAARIGYIALFDIAVETGVVMVIYLHEALDRRLAAGPIDDAGIEQAAIEGAVQRLRPKLMTVAVVMLSIAPILWESGIGSDVMKPIAAPIVGGNDHINHSHTDFSAGILCDHERESFEKRNAQLFTIVTPLGCSYAMYEIVRADPEKKRRVRLFGPAAWRIAARLILELLPS